MDRFRRERRLAPRVGHRVPDDGLPFGQDIEAIHAMLAAYGRDPGDPRLEPFLAAPILMAASWLAVTGEYRGIPIGDRLTRQLAWLESTQGR